MVRNQHFITIIDISALLVISVVLSETTNSHNIQQCFFTLFSVVSSSAVSYHTMYSFQTMFDRVLRLFSLSRLLRENLLVRFHAALHVIFTLSSFPQPHGRFVFHTW